MKKYSIDQLGVIGGQENDSDLYIKNVDLDTNHFDKELHNHTDSDEFYILLDGEVDFETETDIIRAKTGDVLCFSKDENHRIAEVIQQTKMLILKTTGCSKENIESVLSQQKPSHTDESLNDFFQIVEPCARPNAKNNSGPY